MAAQYDSSVNILAESSKKNEETSKLKNSMNYGKGYRDCIKRNGDKTRMQSTCYIVTSCHGNNDEMWSTSFLIMQNKPYIVELRFSETQKSNDSIN